MGIDLGSYFPWRISGTYLEACNCEAICPCRRIGGQTGGRSTYGVCLRSLSWQIEEGEAGKVGLAGMRAVLACRYDDDEPGSPWSFALYIDERGDERQREALESISWGASAAHPSFSSPGSGNRATYWACAMSRSRWTTCPVGAGFEWGARSMSASASHWPVRRP